MKICPICQRCYEDTDTVCLEDQSALVPSRSGSRLIADKYRLDRLLGRGGMGCVYAGTHVDLDRRVAIKLLLSDFTADPDALERFRREARAAARLNHQNVADTYDYGLLPDGGAYIVMELVGGQTLREYMNATGALPVAEAMMIARQVADGVEAAHARGIVHRDLKPSNIILTHDHQNLLQAKVADFGIAKLKEHSTTGGALTASGSLIGTPRYMSPEQCSGHTIDARSDIYSIGVILYEMLTGRPPFDAQTATAIAIKHIQEPPPPLKKFRPDIPDALEQLVLQALDKDPAGRPQSAGDLARRLSEVASALSIPEVGVVEAAATRRARDPQTPRPTQSPDTNPSPREHGSETARTGQPTLEHSHAPLEVDHDPSVEAYAVVPETATEMATKVSGPPQSDQTSMNGAVDTRAASPSSATLASGEVEKPGKQRRTPFLYAGLAAVVATIIVGALWLATRRPPQSETDSGQPAGQQTARTNDTPTPSPVANVSGTDSSGRGQNDPRTAQAELRSLLDGWIAATNSRDVARQIDFYAPTLDVFYLKRNVSLAAVRAEKARLAAQASSISMRVSEPQTTVSGDGRAATMRFRKSWDFKGAQPSSGEVVQELQWIMTDAGWKIKSERDVQVIR